MSAEDDAARMGDRAGRAFRSDAVVTRCPFSESTPRLAALRRAWVLAYVAAAYGAPRRDK